MKAIATTFAATLAVALAPTAFGQETTIKVPQGSGVFPTVGQVNCLEELGSGRLCAATYECSEGSGRLWGDLANHDGRRAIGEDSPIARGRDCVVTIDGRAAVQWLTAYSPGGRTGELVGLTTRADALRPVVTTDYAGEDGGSLLAYILQRHNTTLREIVDYYCEYTNNNPIYTSADRQFCESYHLGLIFGHVDVERDNFADVTDFTGLGFADLQENSLTRCLVELYDDPEFCRFTASYLRDGQRHHQLSGGCDDDNRVMAYHLLWLPSRYVTFEPLDTLSDDRLGMTDINATERAKECAEIAGAKLPQYGVEYDHAVGVRFSSD